MKKLVIPISILSLVAVGIILSLPKDGVEKENTQIVQTQNKEEIENRNTNQNKNKGGEDEKIIINTVTGENVPEGFYDEELVDGYTYNNPKPFDVSIVTLNENPDVPGYITEDQVKNLSESWLVPNYPFEEYIGGYNAKTILGVNYYNVDISFPGNSDLAKIEGKIEFTQWFDTNYGYKFVFIDPEKVENNSRVNKHGYWSILILDENLDIVKNLSKSLENNYNAGDYNEKYTLHKYRGTELEKIARKRVQEFNELSEN